MKIFRWALGGVGGILRDCGAPSCVPKSCGRDSNARSGLLCIATSCVAHGDITLRYNVCLPSRDGKGGETGGRETGNRGHPSWVDIKETGRKPGQGNRDRHDISEFEETGTGSRGETGGNRETGTGTIFPNFARAYCPFRYCA